MSATKIAITAELAENLPKVSIERRVIEQVLRTLIASAECSIRQNVERPGRIHVRTGVQGKRVQITVADNGRGIPWLELTVLFGNESRDAALTACAEIARDNGGELYAWSKYGHGSEFTFELPIHFGIGEEEKRDSGAQTSLHGKNILVIDDETQIRTLMFDILRPQGAQIDLAHSGLQAVERIKNKQYDLFICDQRMPDLSGESLYRSVETLNPQFRDRFLFVTGDAMNDDSQDFFTQTGVPYIQKPFRTIELVAAAEQVVSRSQRFDS